MASYWLFHIARVLATYMEPRGPLAEVPNRESLAMPSDVLAGTAATDFCYRTLVASRMDWAERTDDLLRADICWFTDGSKSSKGTGAGAFCA